MFQGIMEPTNWTKFKPNLQPSLLSALKLAKNLPSSNVGIYCQDKSARICFADLEKTNAKVELVLSDETKYQKLTAQDPAKDYQKNISNWYSRHKSSLKSVSEDVSSWLVPSQVSTPHLRALIKNHKSGSPVRLTFSSVGTANRNLSTLLDTIYLKPSLPSFSPRRLTDTKQAALFLESVNQHILDNNIKDKPTIFALDVKTSSHL